MRRLLIGAAVAAMTVATVPFASVNAADTVEGPRLHWNFSLWG